MGTMTGVEINAAVRSNLGALTTTDTSDATVLPWINWAILHLASPKVYRHPELETTTTQTMVAGTSLYTVAAATGIGSVAVDSVVIVNPSNAYQRRRLAKKRSRWMHEMTGTVADSEPQAYSRWGGTQIRVFPAPSSAFAWTLSIQRLRTPALYVVANLSAGTVTAPYGDQWDEAIVQGATWRGFRARREWTRAEQAKTEFNQLVLEIAERLDVEDEDIDYGPPLHHEEVM